MPSRRRLLTTLAKSATATVGIVATAGCTVTMDRPSGGTGSTGVGGVGTAGTGVDLEPVGREDADVIATTAQQLIDAASSAQPLLIWVPGNARIDLSGETFTVQNCTVASNGNPGALLYTTSKGAESASYRGGGGTGVFRVKDNVRFTGVRLRGPTYNYWSNPSYPGYLPLMSDSERQRHHARCMSIAGHPVVIDTCEIFGWATQGVVIGTDGVPVDPTIANVNFHDNQMTSYGYGVEVVHGHPLVDGWRFDAHRHAIAGFGYGDCSYTVRNCRFGRHPSLHVLDMHRLEQNLEATSGDPSSDSYAKRAGGTIVITNNVFLASHVIDGPGVNFAAGDPIPAVGINGIPKHRVVVAGNAFKHPAGPRNMATRDVPSPAALRQTGVDSRSLGSRGFVNWTLSKNQFGLNVRHYLRRQHNQRKQRNGSGS